MVPSCGSCGWLCKRSGCSLIRCVTATACRYTCVQTLSELRNWTVNRPILRMALIFNSVIANTPNFGGQFAKLTLSENWESRRNPHYQLDFNHFMTSSKDIFCWKQSLRITLWLAMSFLIATEIDHFASRFNSNNEAVCHLPWFEGLSTLSRSLKRRKRN